MSSTDPTPPRPRRRRPPVDPVKVAAYQALDGAELQRLLERQGGNVCLVCGRGGPGNSLYPREEHVLLDRTGTVRGFVCRLCDNTLALFDYDASTMFNARIYLDAINPTRLAQLTRYGSWPGACVACGSPRGDDAAEFPLPGEGLCARCADGARRARQSASLTSFVEALDQAGFVPPLREIHPPQV